MGKAKIKFAASSILKKNSTKIILKKYIKKILYKKNHIRKILCVYNETKSVEKLQ
jgi:hypothetical protein